MFSKPYKIRYIEIIWTFYPSEYDIYYIENENYEKISSNRSLKVFQKDDAIKSYTHYEKIDFQFFPNAIGLKLIMRGKQNDYIGILSLKVYSGSFPILIIASFRLHNKNELCLTTLKNNETKQKKNKIEYFGSIVLQDCLNLSLKDKENFLWLYNYDGTIRLLKNQKYCLKMNFFAEKFENKLIVSKCQNSSQNLNVEDVERSLFFDPYSSKNYILKSLTENQKIELGYRSQFFKYQNLRIESTNFPNYCLTSNINKVGNAMIKIKNVTSSSQFPNPKYRIENILNSEELNYWLSKPLDELPIEIKVIHFY